MIKNGDFGIDAEFKINNSKIRKVFTPHRPIDAINHFFGREKELSRLVGLINTPGQYALLYGDRGVGKTSLSIITCKLILQRIQKGKFFDKRCDSSDTFSSIFQGPLKYVGVDVDLAELSEVRNEEGNAGINAGFMKAGVKSKTQSQTKHVKRYNISSPSWVAKRISKLHGLMLIDEADAIRSAEDKKKLAEIVKILSDLNSDFKILIVGIAKTGEELTAGHKSVERCLKEVMLSRMSDSDLKKIVLNGMKELSLLPDDKVVDCIVDISAGYPHFTHLICAKCAEICLLGGVRHVTMEVLREALKEAVQESEGALRRMFESTIRTAKNKGEYKSLLLAASYCQIGEFRVSDISSKLSSKLGVTVDRKVVSRYMSKLVSDDGTKIFTRITRGVYQFSDPRMPSFIKMELCEDHICST